MLIDAYEAFLNHSAQESPRECCGLIVHDDYLPCRNVADDPLESFVIDPRDWDFAEDCGTIQAACHSHPRSRPTASAIDREGCKASGIPWFILGAAGALNRIDPEPIPFLDRPFVYGWSDCYSLVRDYLGIEADYPREPNFWNRDYSPYLEYFAVNGFREVPREDARREDLVLMRIRPCKSKPNHAGILLGDGTVMHHLWGRRSSIDLLTPLLPTVTHILRRESR